MTSVRLGAVVLGMALAGFTAAATPAQVTAPAAAQPGTTEVTGAYRGYSSKWINVMTEDHRLQRFEVDERSLPGWQKRFKLGEEITVTYRKLSSRHMPVAIGLRKADTAAKKK